jgi:hypothetical protein
MLQFHYSSVLWKCAFLASEVLTGILYFTLEPYIMKVRTSLLFMYLCVPLSDENLDLFIPAVMNMKWCGYKS